MEPCLLLSGSIQLGFQVCECWRSQGSSLRPRVRSSPNNRAENCLKHLAGALANQKACQPGGFGNLEECERLPAAGVLACCCFEIIPHVLVSAFWDTKGLQHEAGFWISYGQRRAPPRTSWGKA